MKKLEKIWDLIKGDQKIQEGLFIGFVWLFVVFLIICFWVFQDEIKDFTLSFQEELGKEIEVETFTPTLLSPRINPTAIPEFIVQECRVSGEASARVATYVVTFRDVNGIKVPNFITDEGMVGNNFPSFEEKDFLLVCFPKELGKTWAEQLKADGSTYQEVFFHLIGTQPVNEKTGLTDVSTIERGFWFFLNPESSLILNSENRSNDSENNMGNQLSTSTPTPLLPVLDMSTPTPAPTVQPTPTTMVEVTTYTYEDVSVEDLFYNRGLGPEIWAICTDIEFRTDGGFGYVEAACPSFNEPTLFIKRVIGLGEYYNLYWSGDTGGGTWYTRGGHMAYGNGGSASYVYTNTLGIPLYSVGFGMVTLSPIQLFVPTPTPAPTEIRPQFTPSRTAWYPQTGCAQITWEWLQNNSQVLYNERGDTVLQHRADGSWWGNNNAQSCYIITGLPSDVVDIDTGMNGVWNQKTISLGWLDKSYQGNVFFYHISANVWVGMVDKK